MRLIAALMFIPALALANGNDHNSHNHHDTHKSDRSTENFILGAVITCVIVSTIRGKFCFDTENESKPDPEPLKITPDNLSDKIKVEVE